MNWIGTFFLLVVPLIGLGQKPIKAKKAEEKFALHVVRAIIDHDCDAYYNAIDDNVVLYLRVEDTVFAKRDIENKLKMLCQISVKDSTLDFDYYVENFELQFYKVESLRNVEFYSYKSKSSTLGTLDHYDIQKGDILFNGARHKSENGMDYILDDAFKFLFRKIDGEYRIILLMN